MLNPLFQVRNGKRLNSVCESYDADGISLAIEAHMQWSKIPDLQSFYSLTSLIQIIPGHF